MPMNSEQSVGDEGDGEFEAVVLDGKVELIDEIVAAARLLLSNIHIEPFNIAGVSVSVRGRS